MQGKQGRNAKLYITKNLTTASGILIRERTGKYINRLVSKKIENGIYLLSDKKDDFRMIVIDKGANNVRIDELKKKYLL